MYNFYSIYRIKKVSYVTWIENVLQDPSIRPPLSNRQIV